MSYWRTMFGGRGYGGKPRYPINPVVLPTPVVTTVIISAPPPPPTLGALTFSATTFTVGTSASGSIIGATALSTITASGLPAGLTINGAARTWAWDGTGTASTGSFTLTETLAGAVGSPKPTTISYSIAAAGAAPALKFNLAANSQYVALVA